MGLLLDPGWNLHGDCDRRGRAAFTASFPRSAIPFGPDVAADRVATLLAEFVSVFQVAGTFPIWDLMFGTWYMPENELPDAYGVDDAALPESFGGQMLYPFRQ